jgi:hypothetical protein
MNSRKVEALLNKYWDGDADQQEELELKKFFSSEAGSLHRDAEYFRFLNLKNAENPLDNKFDEELLQKIGHQDKPDSIVISFSTRYWYIAASLALFLSVSIIFKDEIFKGDVKPPVAQADTFEDPEKAFEETKKALLFLSSRLNQSNEYASQFSKFEKSQEVVKQN